MKKIIIVMAGILIFLVVILIALNILVLYSRDDSSSLSVLTEMFEENNNDEVSGNTAYGYPPVKPITRNFVINGQYLVSEKPVLILEGEDYYLCLDDAARMLEYKISWDQSGDILNFSVDGKNFVYYISKGQLTEGGNYSFSSKDLPVIYDGEIYISTHFLEYYFNCNITDLGETENTVYLNNKDFGAGKFNYEWTDGNRSIAHAMGRINNQNYTNSREAFIENYKKGFRVFEVDLSYTSDNTLVGIHDWSNSGLLERYGFSRPDADNKQALSLDGFRKLSEGNYTPMTFSEMVNLLEENTDAYLLIDGKLTDEAKVKKQYRDIINTALASKDKTVIDRIIPQCYSQEMYEWLMELYAWNSLVYSWYMLPETDLSPEEELNFCMERDIKVVIMDDVTENELIDREILNRGMRSYVHTINKAERRDRLKASGVYGIITDCLI